MSFIPGVLTVPVTNLADVAIGITDTNPVEPHLAINPTDPGNIAITSQNFLQVQNDTNATLTRSTTRQFTFPTGTNQFDGDTSVAFDSQGRMFWTIQGGVGQMGEVVERRNTADGTLIGNAVQVDQPPAGQSDDRQYLAADSNVNSPFRDNLYLAWTRFNFPNASGTGTHTAILFSRSTNNGATWSAPIELSNNNGTEGYVTDPVITVAPNGDVWIAFHSQTTFIDNNQNPNGTTGQVFVARSTNGGVNFTRTGAQPFGPGAADITFNVQARANNQNATRTVPGARFWTLGSVKAYILVDPVRPNNVYVVANDDPNNGGAGDPSDLFIARSTNNGATWAISTIETGPAGTFQFFPTAAIDRFGDIVVTWYDNRAGLRNATNDFLLDVFARYSTDGGVTWSQAFQVNDNTNHFDPFNGAPSLNDRLPFPPSTFRIGEYFGTVVFGGTAYVAWISNTFDMAGNVNGAQVSFDAFPLNGALTVNGDDAGTADDNILIRAISNNSNFFEVVVNGATQYVGLISALTGLTVNGLAGNDTLTVDFSNGNPLPSGGLTFNGGANTTRDTLSVIGAGLNFALTGTSITAAATGLAVSFATVERLALGNGTYNASGTIAPAVDVNNLATLIGNATIQGAVTANAGGVLSPGVAGPGAFGTGNLGLVAGASYPVDLNGLTPGTLYDQLRVTGSVSLGGATLSVNANFSGIPGDAVVIIRNDGSDPVSGVFAGLPVGSVLTVGTRRFAIDYGFDGDGDGNANDVALIAFGAALAPDPCDPAKTALFVSATAGNDEIRFVPLAGNSVIQVLINGNDEGAFSPTGLLIAFAQDGNDTVSVEAPSRMSWLYGQGGDDTLIAANNDSILIGGLGADRLFGGNGKDILIGGRGADLLDSGNGEDLLIAASTVYDANTPANFRTLCGIQTEWIRGMGGYLGRIAHLTTGGGFNGTNLLNNTTVLNDNDVDRLLGGFGRDWFILHASGAAPLDTSDSVVNEVLTEV